MSLPSDSDRSADSLESPQRAAGLDALSEKQPESVGEVLERARMLMRTGRSTESVQLLENCEQLAVVPPQQLDWVMDYASAAGPGLAERALDKCRRIELRWAIEGLKPAWELNVAFARAFENAGRYEESAGRYALALEVMERDAVVAEPWLLTEYAEVLCELGRLRKQALETASSAAEDGIAHDLALHEYEHSPILEQALELSQRAFRQSGRKSHDLPRIIELQSRVLEELDRIPEALGCLQLAIEERRRLGQPPNPALAVQVSRLGDALSGDPRARELLDLTSISSRALIDSAEPYLAMLRAWELEQKERP